MRLMECVKSYFDETTSTDRDQLAWALLYSMCGESTRLENSKPEDSRITELLLQNGAAPNYVLGCELTPLLAAIEYYQPEKVKLLITYSANVNLTDEAGNLPLKYAVGSEYDFSEQMHEPVKINITRILFEAGADPNLKGVDGKSALDLAEELKHEAAVKLFKQGQKR